MPITRYIPVRPRLSGKDALSVLISASSVTREIADLLQCTPAKAAASLLLVIFETVQSLQTNRQDCYRLARRCLSLLVDIRDQLEDHWDSSPPSLLRAFAKFEQTLEEIYKFIKQEADQKWGARLMRKSTIETALSDYNAALDDAARAFQIATLINIHLAVGEATTPENRKNRSKLSVRTRPGETSDSASLPAYSMVRGESADAQELLTDAGELTMSPRSRSGTGSVFELVDRSSPSDLNTNSPPVREASFDLIELFTSASTALDFDAAALNIATSLLEEDDMKYQITEHHGFSRYHQSQFRLKGKSRTIKEGWWAGAAEGDISGQKALMLRYEGERQKAMKRWVRDVKLLQNVYHPNLPQMVGYSNDETPTPFILLANVQTRLPQALLLDSLKNASLARCAKVILEFYRDTLDAALYLQQQLGLSDSKLQDYVENASYRIDAEESVVMGLPPPEVDNIHSFRNYGLAYSIRDIYLKLLPNRGLSPQRPVSKDDTYGPPELQRKVNHLTVLARALLPSSEDMTLVQSRLHRILGSEEEDEEMSVVPLESLRQIRKAAFAANAHQQAWFENNGITPHRFSVGDLGYLPKRDAGEEVDWKDFVVLCNVLEDGHANFEVNHTRSGKQGSWQGRHHNWDDLTSYELPGEVHGWTIIVPPEAEYIIHVVYTDEVVRVHEAWDHLLDSGKAIAEDHGIKPEDLILITRVGTEQRFRVRDLRRIRYWASHNAAPGPGHGPGRIGFPGHSQFHGGGGQFGHQPFGHQPSGWGSGGLIPGQNLAPKVFFLLTSGCKEHEPYFALTPVPPPRPKGEKPPGLDSHALECFAHLDITYAFLNYVQLHAEDFAE